MEIHGVGRYEYAYFYRNRKHDTNYHRPRNIYLALGLWLDWDYLHVQNPPYLSNGVVPDNWQIGGSAREDGSPPPKNAFLFVWAAAPKQEEKAMYMYIYIYTIYICICVRHNICLKETGRFNFGIEFPVFLCRKTVLESWSIDVSNISNKSIFEKFVLRAPGPPQGPQRKCIRFISFICLFIKYLF